MEIKNNTQRRVCDMGTCRSRAKYCITFGDVPTRIDVCHLCLLRLYKEIKRVLYEKKDG